MANVFICHRSIDKPQARRLKQEIEAAGHDVGLDEERIDVGDSIVARIDEGLAGAAYLVLCLSSSGPTSPWMDREWTSALARQLDGHRVKLLPVRLTGGEPPAILADIKYADLVADWTAGVAALLRAIR